MIEEIATVSALHPEGVEVVCFSKSACGQCQHSNNCGTGLVSKALPGQEHRFIIATELSLTVNQQVRIGIPEQGMITSAGLIYLMPLLLILAGALLASVGLKLNDGGTILGAVIGGVIGFSLAARLARRTRHQLTTPIIIAPLLPVHQRD